MKDYGGGLVLILIICLFVKQNHERDETERIQFAVLG